MFVVCVTAKETQNVFRRQQDLNPGSLRYLCEPNYLATVFMWKSISGSSIDACHVRENIFKTWNAEDMNAFMPSKELCHSFAC